jgi:DnaK suppressor protein
MHTKQRAYFKKQLTDELNTFARNEREAKSTLRVAPEKPPDIFDQAVAEGQLNFNLRILERDSTVVGEIRQAMRRIEEGTFGICAECGEEIPAARLKALPAADVCVDCKRRMEAGKRPFVNRPNGFLEMR